MRIFWPGLILLAAFPGLAQNDDLSARLRRVYGTSEDGELALRQLKTRDFLSLERSLERRTTVDQPNLELLSLEGVVSFMAGDMPGAIVHFKNAAEVGPLNDRDAFTNAMALVSLGDNRQASTVIASLAEKYPKRALYMYWEGRIDYDLRVYPKAIEKLQKATELDPDSARAWDALGLAFDMEGQAEQALRAFRKAVDLNRKMPHPSAWPPHNLGYWYLRTNQLKNAESALQESVRYDPKLAATHYHLGRALDKDGQEEQAIAEYQNAIAQDTSSPEACYSLAMVYRRLHRDKEATALFTEYRKRKEARPAAGSTTPMEPH